MHFNGVHLLLSLLVYHCRGESGKWSRQMEKAGPVETFSGVQQPPAVLLYHSRGGIGKSRRIQMEKVGFLIVLIVRDLQLWIVLQQRSRVILMKSYTKKTWT